MAARSKLIASVESLGDVHIQREILQGGSLSPLLSTLCVITLSLILRKGAAPYEWGDKELRINHLYSWMVANDSPIIRTKNID